MVRIFFTSEGGHSLAETVELESFSAAPVPLVGDLVGLMDGKELPVKKRLFIYHDRVKGQAFPDMDIDLYF